MSEEGKRDLPVEQISDLYFMSEVTLNSKLINFTAANGIMMHFFNYYSYYTGSFVPKESHPAGNILVEQVLHYHVPEKRMVIARKIIEAAAYNIYRNLRYYNERGKDVQSVMTQIEALQSSIVFAKTPQELMGVEGSIRKAYYSAWNTIIDQEISFSQRIKRSPDNMINTLISFVNSLIYTQTLREAYHTQLNPTISYVHEPGDRRFSLCLDISEIFKPLIGDRLIFSLLNKNQITEKDFTSGLNFLHLKKEASQKIMQELDEKLKTTIKHKDLGRSVSYEYLIRLEYYKLIKHLVGEKEYDGFKIWW